MIAIHNIVFINTIILFVLYNNIVMSHQIILPSGTTMESVAKTLIINEKNEALVLTIGVYEGHPEKSYQPDLPGGQVELGDGESEKAGAIREAREEAGIVIDPKDMFLAYTRSGMYVEKNKSMSFFLYIAHLDYTPEVVVSWEHESYEWIPIVELLEKKQFGVFYKEAIEYAVANKLL